MNRDFGNMMICVRYKNTTRDYYSCREINGRRCLVNTVYNDNGKTKRLLLISGLEYYSHYRLIDLLEVYMYSKKDLDKYLDILTMMNVGIKGGTYDIEKVEEFFNGKY